MRVSFRHNNQESPSAELGDRDNIKHRRRRRREGAGVDTKDAPFTSFEPFETNVLAQQTIGGGEIGR